MDLAAIFEKHNDEFLKFDRVISPRHPRPDLCAFLMLHDLSDGKARDMIGSAGDDEIWLDADPESVASKATEDDIIALIRCGIRYEEQTESFCMFV